MYITISLLVLVSASSAVAQDWAGMHALPPNTRVRIQNRQGGEAEGLLQSVEDLQLTIVRGKQSFVIQKDVIKRVQVRKRDTPAEGILGGLLYAVLTHRADGAVQTALPVIAHYVGSIGVGALIDWRNKNHRTVYKAP